MAGDLSHGVLSLEVGREEEVLDERAERAGREVPEKKRSIEVLTRGKESSQILSS